MNVHMLPVEILNIPMNSGAFLGSY